MNSSCIDQFPDVIRIEATGKCNFRCRHCPTSSNPNSRSHLTRKMFGRLLSDFEMNKYVPRVIVLYHAGEPLLNVHLEYFIRELKRYGVKKTVITTNASLLTKEKSIQLIEAGLDEMKVSFDGNSADENDEIRQKGMFKREHNNISTLCEMKRKRRSATPKIIISNVRIAEHDEIEGCLAREGACFLSIPEYLVRAFKDVKDEVEFRSCPAMAWPSMKESNVYSIAQTEIKSPNYCPNLFETMTILSDGNVVPCCYDLSGEVVFGNVLNQRLVDIWRSDTYTAFRDDFRKRIYSELCNMCVVIGGRYLCKTSANVSQSGNESYSAQDG